MLAQPANREHFLTRRDVIAYSRFISGLAAKASFTASFCCMEENPGAGDIRSESTRLRESRVLRLDQDRPGRLFGIAQKCIGNKVGHEVQWFPSCKNSNSK
jgi:hypothetical protein